eukprot:TRINITY_DN2796_c0_g1_i1.p1 TRINITY_DN2796_c0_g1~~TRINITY_DN2796_c0_g1_i1.p1  ORF type:complete len:792 (-),score=250.17 TRINITY_DN2796_c0_g1_i1:8-2287(-)
MEVDLSMMTEQQALMKRLAESNHVALPRRLDLPQLYFNEELIIAGFSAHEVLDELHNSKQLLPRVKEALKQPDPESIPFAGIWHPGNGKKPRMRWGDLTPDQEEEEEQDGEWEYEDEDEDEEEYEYEYEEEEGEKKEKEKVKKEKVPREISSDEREEIGFFVEYINQIVGEDPFLLLVNKVPLNATDESLFDKLGDGIILCKLLNHAVANTVDERVLNIKKKLNAGEKFENVSLVLNSAKAIGCNVSGLTIEAVREGKVAAVLNLVWQILRIGLLERVTPKHHPELLRLKGTNEPLNYFVALQPDLLLLRWVNVQLQDANYRRAINNFGKDLSDGAALLTLLRHLSSKDAGKPLPTEPDHRHQEILALAKELNCSRFLNERVLRDGIVRFNLGFLCYLFDHKTNLEALTPEESAVLDASLFNSEGTREARVFTLWINSLGVESVVGNLLEDLKSGIVLLQVLDKLSPGSVEWSKVNKTNLNKFKMVENCNLAVDVAKKQKFSVVGIGGSDIYDGTETLILGLVWQLMRFQVISILKSLAKGDKDITEAEIVAWSISQVRGLGKTSKMDSFKDPTLKNSKFILDLLNSLRPGVVNYDLILDGQEEEDLSQNAKYAISVARKLGASIFLLPEDIVEVRPKMLLTFFGTVMALSQTLGPPPDTGIKPQIVTDADVAGKVQALAPKKELKEWKPPVAAPTPVIDPNAPPRRQTLGGKPAAEEEDEEYEYEEDDGEGEGAEGEAAAEVEGEGGDDEYEYEEVEE